MKKVFLITGLFLIAFILSFVYAGYRPPFGGEYTNICGSGLNANFYSCPASCNINEGWCETRNNSEWIYVFVCDGKVNECRSGMMGPFQGRKYLTSFASVGSNKTVQIDVFNKVCNSGGSWTCSESNLLGYIVWWSGTSGGGGGQVQCNENEVQLSVSPNPANIGNFITFSVVAGDASTWWRNEFSGGVSDCSEINYGWSTRCRAVSSGTFTWTRIWRHCVSDINNCSQECRKSISFTIRGLRPPVVITLPAVVTY